MKVRPDPGDDFVRSHLELVRTETRKLTDSYRDLRPVIKSFFEELKKEGKVTSLGNENHQTDAP